MLDELLQKISAYTKVDARKTVHDAALELDETMPGWALNIDLNSLQMWSCCKCVLGQLFNISSTNVYSSAIHVYMREHRLAFSSGGSILKADAPDIGKTPDSLWYKALDLLWTEEITSRQGELSAP